MSSEDKPREIFSGNPIELKANRQKEEVTYRDAGVRVHDMTAGMKVDLGALGPSMSMTPNLREYDEALILPSAPTLPEDAHKISLVEFEGMAAQTIMSRVLNELKKHNFDIASKTDFQVKGSLIKKGDLFKIVASLYCLASKKTSHALEMRLVSGDRMAWMSFISEISKPMGGKVNPSVRDFLENFEKPPLDPSGKQVELDLDFVKTNAAMVQSGFTENQIQGLKGLKEVADYCAKGDSLAVGSIEHIVSSLGSAASKYTMHRVLWIKRF